MTVSPDMFDFGLRGRERGGRSMPVTYLVRRTEFPTMTTIPTTTRRRVLEAMGGWVLRASLVGDDEGLSGR